MKTIDPSAIKDFNQYAIQAKLNGIYAMWTGSHFKTKNGKIITSVHHLAPDIPPGTPGELYCHGMIFQDINTIVMTQIDTEQRINFYPHADIKKYTVNTYSQFQRLYEKILSDGYEGVVFTDKTGDQWKHKPRFDMEAVIIGFNKGTGKNAETFGSLKLETVDGERFNCSGVSERDRRRLWIDKAIGQTVTVSYLTITKRGVPVSPSFEHYRYDAPIITHGGKRKGAGRKSKPKAEKRSVKKMYRFTESEHAVIIDAATAAGMKESDFIRKLIMENLNGK